MSGSDRTGEASGRQIPPATKAIFRRSVRALLIDSRGRILLIEHATRSGVVWAAPGGGIEPNETPEQALKRELTEELGWRGDLGLRRRVWSHTIVDSQMICGYAGVVNEYFWIPVKRFDVELAVTKFARSSEGLLRCRWWSRQEIRLESNGATFSPPDLLDRLSLLSSQSSSVQSFTEIR